MLDKIYTVVLCGSLLVGGIAYACGGGSGGGSGGSGGGSGGSGGASGGAGSAGSGSDGGGGAGVDGWTDVVGWVRVNGKWTYSTASIDTITRPGFKPYEGGYDRFSGKASVYSDFATDKEHS